jgi:uncharacterized protein (TIGR02444 family)
MADGFWPFSLAFYNDAEVQASCIAFQDTHGGDVNVMLYLLFRARDGGAYDAAGVASVDAAVAPWREEVVRPLRAERRVLKTQDYLPDNEAQEGFRAKIKKVELDAEKLQQAVLEGNAPPPGMTGLAPRDAASLSLAAYGAMLGTDLPDGLVRVFLDRLEAVA